MAAAVRAGGAVAVAVAAVAVAVVEEGSSRAQRAEEEAAEPGRDGPLVGTPVVEV